MRICFCEQVTNLQSKQAYIGEEEDDEETDTHNKRKLGIWQVCSNSGGSLSFIHRNLEHNPIQVKQQWMIRDRYVWRQRSNFESLICCCLALICCSPMRGWLTLESTERAKKVCLRLREIAPRPEAGSRNLGQTFWPNPYFFYKRQYVSS